MRDLLRTRPVAQHQVIQLRFIELALLQHLHQRFLHGYTTAFAKAVQEAEVGRLGRVWNEAEHRVLKVIVDGFDHLLHQLLAEAFALLVDLGIIAPGKVDALKGAGLRLTDVRELLHGEGTAGLHHGHMRRRQLFDVFFRHLKHGHQRHALGGEGEDLVILIVPARADAVRVAHDKEVTAADHPHDGIAAIPDLRGFADHVTHVQTLADVLRNLRPWHATVTELMIKLGMRFIELEANLLQHALRVRAEDGVLSALHHHAVQFTRVG